MYTFELLRFLFNIYIKCTFYCSSLQTGSSMKYAFIHSDRPTQTDNPILFTVLLQKLQQLVPTMHRDMLKPCRTTDVKHNCLSG